MLLYIYMVCHGIKMLVLSNKTRLVEKRAKNTENFFLSQVQCRVFRRHLKENMEKPMEHHRLLKTCKIRFSQFAEVMRQARFVSLGCPEPLCQFSHKYVCYMNFDRQSHLCIIFKFLLALIFLPLGYLCQTAVSFCKPHNINGTYSGQTPQPWHMQ